ncbi:NfeD family protein [Rhodoferax sp.]|uniref:NfeD family protein n=1 Tax=Rhodoferax sp. TaxID=50421 RepID=UPI00276123E4|nr:NfeD family protein [Rhodoferax sp.]
MSRHVLTWVVSLSLVVLGLFAHFAAAQPQPPQPIIYVLPIKGVIDLGLAPFVARVLDEATQAGAAAVILEIDTFGGRVDAAVQIRDALLGAKVRTVAFVNKRAISAGALIALSAQTLVMATGGTIGAAAPVQVGLPGAAAQPVQEKTVSYVRKEFRATAEARKRPLLLAEAMVDADVEVPGVIEKGKLLTLTTDEALQHKVADFRADTLEQALQQLGLAGAQVRSATPHWAEQLVRFLTHPVVSSLLISMGMLGIMVELRTPGFGIAGGVGVASLALFFWGHWLVQLAGWEELLLLGIGLVLLMVELFLLPGFGVAGALGIAALLGALALSMVGAGDTVAVILDAVGRVALSLLLALLASLALLRFLPRLPFARRMILETDLGSGPAHGSAPQADLRWLGKQGLALSVLRPAGIAEIEGERVDVVSDGAMIEVGAPIEVMRVDGNRIVVRRVPHLKLEH